MLLSKPYASRLCTGQGGSLSDLVPVSTWRLLILDMSRDVTIHLLGIDTRCTSGVYHSSCKNTCLVSCKSTPWRASKYGTQLHVQHISHSSGNMRLLPLVSVRNNHAQFLLFDTLWTLLRACPSAAAREPTMPAGSHAGRAQRQVSTREATPWVTTVLVLDGGFFDGTINRETHKLEFPLTPVIQVEGLILGYLCRLMCLTVLGTICASLAGEVTHP